MPAELSAERRAAEREPLPCPRCDSTNTKFCYYNNYNFSQPRHFCKSCRRYWTHGGTLRDVPVGGGSRRTAKRLRTAEPIPSTPVFVSLSSAGPGPGHGGGFSSMLSGLGLGDAGFGLAARGVWAFPEVGFVNGGGDTWQVGSGGDCFASSLPAEFAISTQGNGLK